MTTEAAKTANRLRYKQKVREYLANPNLCLQCGKPILPTEKQKLSWVTYKKFCNQSCSSKYSNARRTVKLRVGYGLRVCNQCEKTFHAKGKVRRLCDDCYETRLERVGNTRIGDYRKRNLYENARTVAKKGDLSCKVCGYDKHVEVCHIKPVRDFPKTALVKEVNAPENLVLLCPNCHWEFDHGLVEL